MSDQTDGPERAKEFFPVALRAQLADAVLDEAAEAIIACDREGVIRFWNAAATRMFGFTPDAAIGQSLDIIIPERLQARHWEGYRRMMETGESRYPQGHLLSVPGRRQDGSQLSVEFTVVCLKDEGGVVSHIVAIMRDITARFEELKALRRQLRDSASG